MPWPCRSSRTTRAIKVEKVSINSPQGNGKIDGYLVKPANAPAKAPVVIVIHENRGRNPYIEDVTRRFAKAGFIAMSPDGLTSLGGYPGDDEKGGAMFSQVDGAKMREDLYQAAEWLRTQPFSNGKLGAVGFCFGGGVTNQLAVRMGANLAAGVPYYGGQPSADRRRQDQGADQRAERRDWIRASRADRPPMPRL